MMQCDWKTYVRTVGQGLSCPAGQKRLILTRLRCAVVGYLGDHPQASLAELHQRFGTPEEIALSHVEAMEGRELLKALRIRKRIVGIFAALAAAVFLLWAAIVTFVTIDHYEKYNGIGTLVTGQYIEVAPGQYELEILECVELYP